MVASSVRHHQSWPAAQSWEPKDVSSPLGMLSEPCSSRSLPGWVSFRGCCGCCRPRGSCHQSCFWLSLGGKLQAAPLALRQASVPWAPWGRGGFCSGAREAISLSPFILSCWVSFSFKNTWNRGEVRIGQGVEPLMGFCKVWLRLKGLNLTRSSVLQTPRRAGSFRHADPEKKIRFVRK